MPPIQYQVRILKCGAYGIWSFGCGWVLSPKGSPLKWRSIEAANKRAEWMNKNRWEKQGWEQ